MNTNPQILPFIPPPGSSPQQNVQDFVQFCRYELTVFGEKLDWNAKDWDITADMVLRGKSHKIRASWSNHDTSKQGQGPLMKQPFLDFARAYFRYQHAFRPSKAFAWRLNALRALERALDATSQGGIPPVEGTNSAPSSHVGIPSIEDADGAVFNLAGQLVVDKYSPAAAYRIAQNLELLADFINEKGLTRVSFSWRNPVNRVADKNRVGQEADLERATKIPTDEVLQALAKAYTLAKEPRDVLVTSVGALLCCAFCRIGEVLTLPVACEHEDSTSAKKHYALRWRPEKGAEPMLKWIVPTIEHVAREAVKRLCNVTEPWRIVARWYEEHPDKVYLPEGYEHLRNQPEISLDHIAELFGLISPDTVRGWMKRKGITPTAYSPTPSCSFSQFEKGVLSDLPTPFLLDRENELKFSDALFVVPDGFFAGRHSRLTIMAVTEGSITDGLGNRQKHGFPSVFSRLGITSEDGSPIVIRSHQFRHLLNTMAQRGGASQFDIAKVSGRKRLGDNNAYDHTTSEEFLEAVRMDDGGSILGPLGEFLAKTPIPKAEFLSMKLPTAHVTEIGYCVHDWLSDPCPRHLDCINCRSHLCRKGDMEKTRRIKEILAESKQLLAEAEDASRNEQTGADRWLAHQRMTVERLENLVKILDDETVEPGAVISLSIHGEYSAIANAVDDRIQLGGVEAKRLALLLQGPTAALN